MIKFTIFAIIILAFSLNSYAESFTIKISGASYSPNLLTVHIGDEVIISASGAHPLVQVSKATWLANKTTQMPGGWGEKTSNYTFNATVADTIYFLCAVHGPGGMKGRIIVLPSTDVENPPIGNSIYPNPANDFIEIKLGAINSKLGLGVEESTEILIYNSIGELVKTAKVENLTSAAINISNLPTGMYYLRVGFETLLFSKM